MKIRLLPCILGTDGALGIYDKFIKLGINSYIFTL